jgi:hypothetical protein
MNGHLAKPISLVSLREVIARYHREMVVAWAIEVCNSLVITP